MKDWVLALPHHRFFSSAMPSVKPSPDQNSMVALLLSTQVMRLSKSFWLQCGGICRTIVWVTAVGLDKLHALSVELLELLKGDMQYIICGSEG